MKANLKKKVLCFLISCSLFFSGCVPALIGAGALGGYALSTDTASGRVSVSYRRLWDLCIDVLKENDAEFLVTNEARGHIKALVYEHSVTVRIDSITQNSQRLRVAARRYFLPRPQFAQEIFFEIVEHLR